ncbi:RHS repeat domain-containing protein [Chitinophaga silvisoli]|uniref:RHS repeat domain-containing protein n=1 Tax=Chitinophaga silvisoli TaxID=2291814 RepID=UPI001F457628|nr:RHS repeat-associated core domain-containing protein [Chitinophaga silvisoli]
MTAVIEAPYLASTSIISGTVIVGGGTTKAILDAGNNYGYDLIGNMVSDVQGGVSNITWTVYGKIKKITKTDGSTLEYKYDADGNRGCKVYTHGTQVDKTWYVRDASGNVLAIYGNKDGDGNVYWKEQQLYGSSLLGSWYPELNVSAGAVVAAGLWGSTNKKQYELSNHLGNVLATVTDELKADNTALVMSANDYYPFGMIQPDRSYSSGGYRYGFNGKENDNEVKGEGMNLAYENRIYDPRLGKWLSVDPLQSKYPGFSPYNFSLNSPLYFKDIDGRDVGVTITGNTITFSNTFYIQGLDPIESVILQQNYDRLFKGKLGGTYTDEHGKTYEVKFELSFKTATAADVNRISNSAAPIAESLVRVNPDKKKSYSSGSIGGNTIDMSISVAKDIRFYFHEGSHNLGMVDRYDNIALVDDNGQRASLLEDFKWLQGQSVTMPGFEGDPLGGNYKLDENGKLVSDLAVKYS